MGANMPMLKFVAHHLWDPEKTGCRSRSCDASRGGWQTLKAVFLKAIGPHAPATVSRLLTDWSTLTKWRSLDGAFSSPALKSIIRHSVQAVPRTLRRKSAKAVTGT
ncbi:hypothetical protein RU07_01245 [Agrobacterium tumefaciens]|uniref:Uncharacterized protein n=1 Tax=Agrobacterium tumefaciens TaxID=358 RepID=A0A0D0K9Q7_AGRTU|nr:hypothetical protein RU07_01245 [Agrobacterium tumefaciens]